MISSTCNLRLYRLVGSAHPDLFPQAPPLFAISDISRFWRERLITDGGISNFKDNAVFRCRHHASFRRHSLITDGVIYNFKGKTCRFAVSIPSYVHCFMPSFYAFCCWCAGAWCRFPQTWCTWYSTLLYQYAMVGADFGAGTLQVPVVAASL